MGPWASNNDGAFHSKELPGPSTERFCDLLAHNDFSSIDPGASKVHLLIKNQVVSLISLGSKFGFDFSHFFKNGESVKFARPTAHGVLDLPFAILDRFFLVFL